MRPLGLAALLLTVLTVLFVFAAQSGALESRTWHDPSPHKIQFITVDKDTSLEVLDWGGVGRPVVLLAGLGNTAHVFDDFAPKLAGTYHVYGITRRGFGASSAPASGYSADRLGDDVIAVIDSLKLSRPVLVGHSIAGEELSSIGSRHPERVSALIYLEAAYSYAFYDGSRGDFLIDSLDLQRKLGELQPGKTKDLKLLVQELLVGDLPRFEKDLARTKAIMESVPPPANLPRPDTADQANFVAYRAWQLRTQGFAMPEAELREQFEQTATGGVGKPRRESNIGDAILAGEQKYKDIRLPILALFNGNGAFEAQFLEKSVPSARVVRIPHGQHYIFLSNESDVLREVRTFLESLS